jgi:hypothetical protein
METYKLYINKKDNDEKNIDFKLNGINKNLVEMTNKSIEKSRINSNFDNQMYLESLVGNRISRLQNKKSRISNMVGNKAISFSSLVE